MQNVDVSFQVNWALLQYPPFEICEVKGVFVFDFVHLQPLHKKWEVSLNVLPHKHSVYHMTAEYSHLYLIL